MKKTIQQGCKFQPLWKWLKMDSWPKAWLFK